jgi:tetratricopeptide (TPR) repeat protein
MIIALPWFYGCSTWSSQYYLYASCIVLSLLIAVHCVIAWVGKAKLQSIPWLTWVLLFLSVVGYLQSRPSYDWTQAGYAPPSVEIQRWAIGVAPAPKSLEKNLLISPESTGTAVAGESFAPCDLQEIPESERKLAWSVEPLHTRGAIPALVLCGLLVWGGSLVFSESDKQLWLFCAIALIGAAIACVGIHGSISYKSENFLGLRSGGSFATFVSKNSAGGYYNICIAGCLGVLAWTLLNTRRKRMDIRYRFPDSSLLLKVRGVLEDVLADLNTPQIASVMCLVTIVAALMISLCRGAAVSALAAVIAASLIANSKNRSGGSWIIAVVVLIASVACMIGFQLDDHAYSRLESIAEVDIEAELKGGRAYIWSVAWQAMQYYGWLGSGLGTFHFAYLPFQNPSSGGWFYHAESLYAQCAVEMGILGVGVLAMSVLILSMAVQRATPSERWQKAFPAKLAGSYLLISQGLHSLVDFAIILPALFVPASVLMGSVLGSLKLIVDTPITPRKKGSRSSKGGGSSRSLLAEIQPVASTAVPQAIEPVEAKAVRAPIAKLALFLIVALSSSLVFFFSLNPIQSLSMAEEMAYWEQKQNKLPLVDQEAGRTRRQAEIWSTDSIDLTSNSLAMQGFADALVFDYRMDQLAKSSSNLTRDQAWGNSSPLLLQLALATKVNLREQTQIIDSVGGQKALDKLRTAAKWYARGHVKSPLNWKLACGRYTVNLDCDRDALKMLVPVGSQLARHVGQHLLTGSLLYRDYLDLDTRQRIWGQAMRSNASTYRSAARLIANDCKDSEVRIDVFPQRYDILEDLAKQTFTKDKFPETNNALWNTAKELIKIANVSPSRREMWLADTAATLGNSQEEIEHLISAIRLEPSSVRLLCRIANRYLDLGDWNNAKQTRDQANRLDPSNPEVKKLNERMLNDPAAPPPQP